MTNEEKARKIAKKNSQSYGFGLGCDSSIECYDSAIEMAQWKDEQFQKVLDYAENCYGVFSFEQRKNFINHIKEIFYGKE